MHYKCFMHYRLMCFIISVMNANRIGLGITHEVFIFTRHMFMHSLCIHSFSSFLFWTSVVSLFSLSLSLSLSLIKPPYGTQIEEIHFGLEPSSWFRVILFYSSSCSISYLVLWWKGQDGLLWELPETWRSSGMPSYSIEFCRHSSPLSHSNLGLGISTWETHEVSRRVYSRVLLQHTRHQYRCTLVCYYI